MLLCSSFGWTSSGEPKFGAPPCSGEPNHELSGDVFFFDGVLEEGVEAVGGPATSFPNK